MPDRDTYFCATCGHRRADHRSYPEAGCTMCGCAVFTMSEADAIRTTGSDLFRLMRATTVWPSPLTRIVFGDGRIDVEVTIEANEVDLLVEFMDRVIERRREANDG